jgi:lysophospholipid acyltransferase (LPLAT)-like uncharacterized protein
MKNTAVKPTAIQSLVVGSGVFLLRGLLGSLRQQIRDPAGFLVAPPASPVIYAFWHNRILGITAAFRRTYPTGRRGVLVLTSASRDGMWLGEVAGRLGMGAVRGSSSRRGATAMRELLDRVDEGYDIAITPDGPRGPVYQAGPGLAFLAAKAQIPIVPVRARFHHSWRLKTWDRFTIPKPFSKVDVTIDTPLTIPPASSEEELAAATQKIASVLGADDD